jgi:hypothetical protein
MDNYLYFTMQAGACLQKICLPASKGSGPMAMGINYLVYFVFKLR